jgi:hypothetical protein
LWGGGGGGWGWCVGGWRIVIPMPEAINFVDGRRQKLTYSNTFIMQTFDVY